MAVVETAMAAATATETVEIKIPHSLKVYLRQTATQDEWPFLLFYRQKKAFLFVEGFRLNKASELLSSTTRRA